MTKKAGLGDALKKAAAAPTTTPPSCVFRAKPITFRR